MNEASLLSDEQGSSEDERKFFLANLPFNVTEHQIVSFFGGYGTVQSARIVADKQGVSKGYGFVTFADRASAAAVAKLAQEHHNTISMYGCHSVHIAPHDRERAARKAAERKVRREQRAALSKCLFGTPYMPFHPGMMMMSHPPPYSQYSLGVGGGQQIAPQSIPFAVKNMKVSASGLGGFECRVDNVPSNMTLDQFVAVFTSYGDVVDATIRVSVGQQQDGGRLCYGKVQFSTHDGMAAAIFASSSQAHSQPLARGLLWPQQHSSRPKPPAVEQTADMLGWNGVGAFTPPSRHGPPPQFLN